jgi:hypothetical protein
MVYCLLDRVYRVHDRVYRVLNRVYGVWNRVQKGQTRVSTLWMEPKKRPVSIDGTFFPIDDGYGVGGTGSPGPGGVGSFALLP